MKKRSFIAGLAAGILVAALIAALALGIRIWTRPIELSGGGRDLDSPNARYKARAWNMRQRNISGEERDFYSFVIFDNATGLEVCRYEIPMPDDAVWFRGGSGGIDWDGDSSIVRFGSLETPVWSYTLPSSPNKAE
jgi:hypothetical protein